MSSDNDAEFNSRMSFYTASAHLSKMTPGEGKVVKYRKVPSQREGKYTKEMKEMAAATRVAAIPKRACSD